MTTAHQPDVRAEMATVLRGRGYPDARVEVVRSVGDSTDGCLTIFFVSRDGKPLVALVRERTSGTDVDVEVQPW